MFQVWVNGDSVLYTKTIVENFVYLFILFIFNIFHPDYNVIFKLLRYK